MMASTYKVLGQVNSVANTDVILYVVPNLTQTVVSTLTVCNRGLVTNTYRIAIRQGGAALVNSQYIVYDVQLSSKSSAFLTVGLSLNQGDIVQIFSNSNDLSFSVFGTEITA